MPALRERGEDLCQLVQDFIEHNVAEGRPRVQLSAGALTVLSQCAWTGNVRELSNLIERLSILCGDRVVAVADLPARYRPASAAEPAPAGLFFSDATAAAAEATGAVAAIASDILSDSQVLPLLEGAAPPAAAAELAADCLSVLPSQGLDLRAHLAAIERTLIEQALQRSHGTVAQAARLLNLRRTTLVERLRKLEILSATPDASEV